MIPPPELSQHDAQVRGQALPRAMHHFATRELPRPVSAEERWPALQREARNFFHMIDIVSPGRQQQAPGEAIKRGKRDGEAILS